MTVRIPIAVSARHVHLSQVTIDQVFGAGYQLRPRTWLSQTGQFAAQETVTLVGPKGELRKVRVMGPPRERDQVEVSCTDEFELETEAPVRISGDHDPPLSAWNLVIFRVENAAVARRRWTISQNRRASPSATECDAMGQVDSIYEVTLRKRLVTYG